MASELAILLIKVLAGTAAFVGVLWIVRAIDARAVGMTITFPALNGIVLLTATDKILVEMLIGIVPLMALNGTLPALYIALRDRFHRSWVALALCLIAWAGLAILLEWRPVWQHRGTVAFVAGGLVCAAAGWAFLRLRAEEFPPTDRLTVPQTVAGFMRDRAPRIFWFFVSLACVSAVAHVMRDAHSLVGRLSALPLVPLFVLHWAAGAGRSNLSELRVAALMGPVTAGAFLLLFGAILARLRPDSGPPGFGYWMVGSLALVFAWECTRRLIVALSALSYRAKHA